MTRNAGDFDEWADAMVSALDGNGDAEVPCDGCTACCTASQFIHIGPDETDVLAHVPSQLQFPAPGRPAGHLLMGYDEHGRCPMFVDGGCSIYAHRPRTCRTYDCRIFAATEVQLADDPTKAAIAERAAEWEFGFGDRGAQLRQRAMAAAARFVAQRSAELFDGSGGPPPTPRAGLAVELHQLFLGADQSRHQRVVREPDIDAVRVEILQHRPAAC